jgi:nucleotide-binding universal stress UspA family protein
MGALPDRGSYMGELKQFAEGCADGVAIEFLTREGAAWREVVAAAEEWPADLIVMGTHGRGGFERFILGSVAEKVLRSSPCPVLTVCHEEGRTWAAPGIVGHVLCATDLSRGSATTVRYALSLAAEYQARVTLLHVIEGFELEEGPAYLARPRVEELRGQAESAARRELRKAVPADVREWCDVSEAVAFGKVADQAVRVAIERRADLIVLGSRHPSPLERAVFGSTASEVVRRATCPVLSVHSLEDVGLRESEARPRMIWARP